MTPQQTSKRSPANGTSASVFRAVNGGCGWVYPAVAAHGYENQSGRAGLPPSREPFSPPRSFSCSSAPRRARGGRTCMFRFSVSVAQALPYFFGAITAVPQACGLSLASVGMSVMQRLLASL